MMLKESVGDINKHYLTSYTEMNFESTMDLNVIHKSKAKNIKENLLLI